MKHIMLIIVAMLLFAQMSFAATTAGNHIACVSEEKLDEIVHA